MAIATMKTANEIGDVKPNKKPDILMSITETRLIWTPGVKPVTMPHRQPMMIAAMIWMKRMNGMKIAVVVKGF